MATTVTLKPNAIDISGSTSGTTTLQATAVAGTTTLTLPAATDTLVGKATTDTLTNKTLTGAVMNGTVGATTPDTGAFTTLSATGVTTVQAGTAAAPAITTSGDTNTGIFFPAADTIAFTEGGAEAMRIDSSGRVLINKTSTDGGYLNIQNGSTQTRAYPNATLRNSRPAGTDYSVVSWNGSFVADSWIGQTPGSDALCFGHDAGGTIAEDMRIDTSGNVGIGVTPAKKLDVKDSAATSTTAFANQIFQLRSNGSGADATIQFTDSVTYNSYFGSGGGNFYWNTTGAERMRINSSGNVGIGITSPQYRLVVAASGGNSFEFGPENTTSTNILQCYNRTTSAYTNLAYNALSHQFSVSGGNAAIIDSSGNVGIGTSSPNQKLVIKQASGDTQFAIQGAVKNWNLRNQADGTYGLFDDSLGYWRYMYDASNNHIWFNSTGTERMRIDSSGNLLVGKTSTSFSDVGVLLSKTSNEFTVNGAKVMAINRGTDDGVLIEFFQAGTGEGNISVSGTTVSYNGGHLSRWAQTATAKDSTLVKGTVMSNLDDMNVYTDADGNPVDNEQLNKVKVSDVEGDANVAGVFVNWSYDDAHNVDEINMAMTGDMIIRIAQGTTVARGDLLMSAGDGTAKPQGDDIVRSKTVAKVTSTHVTCTYADGSYCVPCVLMAC